MDPESVGPFGRVVVLLLLFSGIGRVALSLLPPGRPGYHELHELSATWAASYLLGMIVLVAGSTLSTQHGLTIVLVLGAAIGVARWMTLPGALAPRHEVRNEPSGRLARLLVICALVLPFVLWLVGRSSAHGQIREDPSAPIGLLALLIVLDEGLRSARRAPLGRALLLFAVSAFFATRSWAGPPARDFGTGVLLAAGAAYSIEWLRRANRRAGALAILFLAAPALLSPQRLALATGSLCALIVATPAPVKQRTALGALLTLAIFAVLGGWRGWGMELAPSDAGATATPLAVLRFVAIVAGLALGGLGLRAARAARHAQSASVGSPIDPPRRETFALGLVLALALAACALRGGTGGIGVLRPIDTIDPALIALVPTAFLWLGLVAIGPETTASRS